LNELDETEAEITSRAGEASGQLKINAPLSFGLLHLASLWPEFMAKHPKVSLDITLGDRTIDLIEEGFDLAVRIGDMPSSSLISRKLGKTRMVLCASPEYVKKQGIPKQPSDLAKLDVISYNLLAMGEDWQFSGPNGSITVKVHPRMRTNSGDTCRIAALLGQGIVLQPSFLIGADLASGALVELLPEYRSVELGIYAVYPTRKFVAPKVRLLIDFLVEALRQSNWQDL
jgi:DNA-binding transcriptional LysR family regulator